MPAKLDSRETHVRLPCPNGGPDLFLRHLGPGAGTDGPVVLYVHGATFSSALSVAHRFGGNAWRDDLNRAGFHVWALDFPGFGESDSYPEMEQPANHDPPLGRATDVCPRLEQAVRFICDRHGLDRISIVAHSWGTIATGLFAERHSDLIDRLVFFGPIARRPNTGQAAALPAWRTITLQHQWDRFVKDVPSNQPPVLSARHFDGWGSRYLDTDPLSRRRDPFAVAVPSGPAQDIADAWHGDLAYDPAAIRTPLAILRGEWDSLCTDDDARWLFDALSASPLKRDVKLGHGTHVMHLEAGRYALYRETEAFLKAGDEPPAPSDPGS